MARILIIDDDEDIRGYLRLILEDDDGHQLQEAENGVEGLELYRKHLFDLVITDILMPSKDGIEMIMEMTEYHPWARIIAISAGGRGLEASLSLGMAQDFGAMRVVRKPFFPEDIRNAVSEALAIHQEIPNLPPPVPIALDGEGIRLPRKCAKITQKALASTSNFFHSVFPSSDDIARGWSNESKGDKFSARNMGS
ncbi:MAG: response regulator [Magnetococcales bacterium]|nr:response regulator [Magnetococcales bacterium]